MKQLKEAEDRIDFFQNSPRGTILRALTLHDITFWATYAFISVVFALFVVEFVGKGNAIHVGISLFLMQLAAALAAIPVGKVFDHYRGYLDEVYALAGASLIAGALYILLSFSTSVWELYILSVGIGIANVTDMVAWRALFYTNIEKEEYSETVGTYQTAMGVTSALAAALAGFIGEKFGFDTVILLGGIVIMIGGFLPLTIRSFFRK